MIDDTPTTNDTGRNIAVPQTENSSLLLKAVVSLFVVSLLSPPEFRFEIGSVLLSPQRIVSTALFTSIPLLLYRGGKLTVWDTLLALYITWVVIAGIIVHKSFSVLIIYLVAIELAGPYFLGRFLARSTAGIVWYGKLCLYLSFLAGSAGILESITGYPLIRDTCRSLTGSNLVARELPVRLGFHRAYSFFEHPILYGIFCASAISWLYIQPWSKLAKGSIFVFITLATFASLSTGAILTLIIQISVLTILELSKRQVKNLRLAFIILPITLIALSLISSRGPFKLFIDIIALNPATGRYRLAIWEHGWAEVVRNPVFGIGFNDWVRPAWMVSPSVDSHWLLAFMRHGMPGGFLAVSLCWGIWISRLCKRQTLSPVQCGWLALTSALTVAGLTVFFWGNLYLCYAFLLGVGSKLFPKETNISSDIESLDPYDNSLHLSR